MIFRQQTFQRDSVWIEIPIERGQSLGDKTIHSEILVTQRKEVANIIKGMPHVAKILFDVCPDTHLWEPKETSL
jgi:hypothetical protein